MRRALAGMAVCIAAATLAPYAVLAAATPAPRSLAVSVPADPVSLEPGQTAPVPIRVVNPGDSPVTVTIRSEGITLGDNGTTKLSGAPDPQWSSRTEFPSGPLLVPARSYLDVNVIVHMPSNISPDLYYVGFLVTPVPNGGGSVTVINQIGAFFIINVPGARDRALTANLDVPGFTAGPIHIDSLIVGNSVIGQVETRNVGPSAVQFFGENDASSSPFTGSPSQQRIPRSLLPIGRERSFGVTAAPAFPIDLVTMTVTIAYPGRVATSTQQIVLTKTMLVISPILIFAVCGLIALLACWRLLARHRRRVQRRNRLRSPERRRGTRATAG